MDALQAINERLDELCGLLRKQNQPELLKVQEAAELLGVSPGNVYNMAHIPGFPAVRIGRTVKIKRRLLLEWLDRQEGDLVER